VDTLCEPLAVAACPGMGSVISGKDSPAFSSLVGRANQVVEERNLLSPIFAWNSQQAKENVFALVWLKSTPTGAFAPMSFPDSRVFVLGLLESL
jgi:hypothetical protein